MATNGLVKVTRDLVGTCASLSSNFQRLIIAQDDVQSEVRMFDVSSSGMSIWSFPEVKSDAFKYCVNLGPACTTSFTGYSGIGVDDDKRQEIHDAIEDYESGGILGLISDLVLPGSLWGKVLAILSSAASHDRQAENDLQGVDVSFNQSRFADADLNIPFGTRFNTCLDVPSGRNPDAGYKAYRLAVHEAGHALGLSNVSYSAWTQPYEAAHPTIPDAALNYDKVPAKWAKWTSSPLNEPDCTPHPFDVMAIYALYQTDP